MSELIILEKAKKHGQGPFWIKLDEIEPIRDNPIKSKIDEYLKLKTQPPPIVISGNKPPYRILDGHHRYEVALVRGDIQIEAYIYNSK